MFSRQIGYRYLALRARCHLEEKVVVSDMWVTFEAMRLDESYQMSILKIKQVGHTHDLEFELK